MKMFEKPSEKDAIAVFLRRSIQVAAENVPVFFLNNFLKFFLIFLGIKIKSSTNSSINRKNKKTRK